MPAELLCMGEPMLEFSLQPVGADGKRLYLEGHGGDTSNAAIAAARAGARVGYITAVGQDPAGDSFLALWQREGVDTSCVFRDPDNPTASYFVTQTPKGHEFLYYRANSAASRFGPDRVPVAAITAARMFYASGISQAISAAAADAVFHAIDTARANGVRVAYDTNFRPRLWPVRRAASVIHAAMAQADVALPSQDDAVLLTGIEQPEELLDFYLRLGPRVVALKMGGDGTWLATQKQRWRIPPFPCVPVDCTGAGDTFGGSFLARLLAGDAPEQAARYAACAAALMTEGYGGVAPIPNAARVRAALAATSALDPPQTIRR